MNEDAWVLGLYDGHDAGACFMKNGAVAFAISEERLTRRKRQSGFPGLAVKLGLGRLGILPDEIGLVVMTDRYGRAPSRILNAWYRRGRHDRGPLDRASRAYACYQQLCSRHERLGSLESWIGTISLRTRLRRMGIASAPLVLIPHHEAHRYAAAYGSGLTDPLILTLDGFGDGLSGSIAVLSDQGAHVLEEIPQDQSLGVLYGEVNQLLGFSDGDEGKTLGIAALADGRDLHPEFCRLLSFADGALNVTTIAASRTLQTRLRGFLPHQLASALQKRAEEIVCDLARSFLRRTDKKEICCAGGVFANVEINRRLADLPENERLYIFPHMNDGGLCVGAASYGWSLLSRERPISREYLHVYWGPDFRNEEVRRILEEKGLMHRYTPDPAKEVARLLADRKVVGWFHGRMEFGPRALGNRSILFSAEQNELGNRVNQMLGRPGIMPFSPVTIDRWASRCYVSTEEHRRCGRFMTMTYPCTEEMRATLPGAVHCNGTARAQILSSGENPLLYELLEVYHRLTGRPALINTSFNRHGEPIVCTPEDAIKTFLETDLDAMMINRYLVTKS